MNNLKFTQISLIAALVWFLSANVNAQVYVNNSGNMGIGTYTPTEILTVKRTDLGARILVSTVTDGSNEAPQMIWRRARSNSGLPAALQAGDNLGAFSFRGFDGANYTGSRGFINIQATENWNQSGNGTRMLFQTTPNGSTAPMAVMEITQDGKVKVNGIELNVPDYVFEHDYKLMDLDELSIFIEKNKHLPDVASADEAHSEGLDLAGSQLALLRKIEELTLYTLEQHEKLKQM